MRRTFYSMALLFITINTFAQEKSVEKSLFGVQLGIYPLSVYHEYKLGQTIALRSEVGFSFAWHSASGLSTSNEWAVVPNLHLEPRYYYNLARRHKLNKRTDHNSGNYLSVNLGYGAGNLAIKTDGYEVFPSVHVVPSFGFRRNIGKSFNFELAFGIGYSWVYKEYDFYNFVTQKTDSYKGTESGVSYATRLAIGYVF